jgi:hypothetical protein
MKKILKKHKNYNNKTINNHIMQMIQRINHQKIQQILLIHQFLNLDIIIINKKLKLENIY